VARFVGAPDYGRVRASLDGGAWSAPIDLKRAEVVAVDDIDLGVCTPARGRISVRIEALPASGEALPASGEASPARGEALPASGQGADIRARRIFGVDGFRLAAP
ncbi:MAG: hypothetical protein ACKOYN_07425, partial [Planctomycetota bacterium]